MRYLQQTPNFRHTYQWGLGENGTTLPMTKEEFVKENRKNLMWFGIVATGAVLIGSLIADKTSEMLRTVAYKQHKR